MITAHHQNNTVILTELLSETSKHCKIDDYMYKCRIYRIELNLFSLDSRQSEHILSIVYNSTISKMTNNQCGYKISKDSGNCAKPK